MRTDILRSLPLRRASGAKTLGRVGAYRARAQRGVSLVEVLVASVVLSIGLLGLAGLQAAGLRVGQSSILRSQAAQMAYDMADRMRVNAANAKDYNLALGDAIPNCNGLAGCDLRDWRLRLQMLPGGTGSVDASAAPQVTIVVAWDDARGGGVLRGAGEGEQEALKQLGASRFTLVTQLTD
jgi:type IV pilus assembly protein PilV